MIAEQLKYWFRDLETTAKECIANPLVIKGHELPFVYMAAVHFISLDPASPYHGNSSLEYGNLDWVVAEALEKAQAFSIGSIDLLFETADSYR
jgi:hypothetical protein